MPRLHLIDPCLTHYSSHPFHYARLLLAAAAERGYEGSVVANAAFARFTRAIEGVSVQATLEFSGYSKYTAFGELDRLDARGRPRLAAPWFAWHARGRREARIAAAARGYADVVAAARPGDVVFIATANELDVAGLARAIRGGRPPRGIAWHAQLHTPLYRGHRADIPRQERRLDRVRRLLRRASVDAGSQRIGLHVTTEELAAEYRRLNVGPIGVLPYPVHPPGPRNPEPNGCLRIATLGDARPEKGSGKLADIVERVACEPTLADRACFAVQTNLGFPAESRKPEHRRVRESLARLAEMPSVRLVDGPLAAEAYAAELAAADVALLPYDQPRYRCRCSGVLLEAATAGILPVVTGGGWMARMLAPGLEEHAAAIRAAGHNTSRRKIAGRIDHAGLAIDLPELSRASHAAAVIVRLRWPTTGDDWHAEPAVDLTLEQSGQPLGISVRVAAGPDGSSAATVFPVPPQAGGRGPSRLLLAAEAAAAGACEIEIEIDVVELTTIPPAAAGGIVIASPDDAPAALADLVRHWPHYRDTAASQAARLCQQCDPRRLASHLLGGDLP